MSALLLREYTEADASAVTALYHDLVAMLPHAWPIVAEELTRALAEGPEGFDDRLLLVAEADADLHGFADAGLWRKENTWSLQEGDGYLRALWFRPAAPEAGSRLLDACLTHLGQHRAQTIHGCMLYPDYRFSPTGLGLISDRWPHLVQLLCEHGFTLTYREVVMDLPSIAGALDGACPQAAETRTAPAGPGFNLDAYVDSQAVGRCNWLPLGRLIEHPGAGAYGFVRWLGVEESFRRRGIGRQLLLTALSQMREQGMTRARLTTGSDNFRAQALYYQLGFQVVDTLLRLRHEPKQPTQ